MEVREGRPEDIAGIASWTHDTFDWGDYVAGSLAEWIASKSVNVFVAVDDEDVPRAMCKVSMLSPSEGWLSATRVHPDYRREGLGILLNDFSVDWVRNQGGLVARLATEDVNAAAQRQVEKLDYRRTCTWVNAVSSAESAPPSPHSDRLNLSGRGDVDPAWMYWSTSEMAEAGRGLTPSGWQWRKTTVEDVTVAASERRLFGSPAGWVIVEWDEASRSLDAVWAATSQNDFPRLVDGVRQLGMSRGTDEVVFRLPQTGWSEEALVREGATSFEVHIYAKAVS